MDSSAFINTPSRADISQMELSDFLKRRKRDAYGYFLSSVSVQVPVSQVYMIEQATEEKYLTRPPNKLPQERSKDDASVPTTPEKSSPSSFSTISPLRLGSIWNKLIPS